MSQPKLGPRAGNQPLSKVTLTYLLIGLAIVPSAATVGLWAISPRVKEGQLPVKIRFLGMPDDPQYYAQPAEARDPLDDPRLEISNVGPAMISNLNVIVNHSHEIRDPKLILEPGETIVYRLKRFYNRAGIPFVPELNPVKHLRVFAKQADQTRASLHRAIAIPEYGQTLSPNEQDSGATTSGETTSEETASEETANQQTPSADSNPGETTSGEQSDFDSANR
jgi:hypothetical protein